MDWTDVGILPEADIGMTASDGHERTRQRIAPSRGSILGNDDEVGFRDVARGQGGWRKTPLVGATSDWNAANLTEARCGAVDGTTAAAGSGMNSAQGSR